MCCADNEHYYQNRDSCSTNSASETSGQYDVRIQDTQDRINLIRQDFDEFLLNQYHFRWNVHNDMRSRWHGDPKILARLDQVLVDISFDTSRAEGLNEQLIDELTQEVRQLERIQDELRHEEYRLNQLEQAKLEGR
ncbi:MAG: hypothetical protein FWE41_00780 [Coriobacteriia bacterium]|nr:hypothetical protein [Coriobacteriia bacterium]MCL2750517.1 hypothetical protein [Coriobacteriia bacterium]